MGVFSKIWDFFVSPIVLKKEKPNELVIPVRLKSSRIKLNKKIVVPDDWWAVVAVKDKIGDILQPGTYKANENDLPITTRTGNALRKNKQGKVIPWIKCSVYYIRKNEIVNHLFRAGLPFIVKTENLGRIKGKVEGSFSVSVTSPEVFLKYLFMEYYRINRNTGLSFVRNLVVEEINALLEHKENEFEKMIVDWQYMTDLMNHIITKHLNKIGVNVYDLQVQSFVLSKKTQKVMSEYLAAQRSRVEKTDKMVTSEGEFVAAINEEKMQSLIAEAQEEKEVVTVHQESDQTANPDLEEILNRSIRPQLVDNTQEDTFLFDRKEQAKDDQVNQVPMDSAFTPRRRGTVDLDLSISNDNQTFSRRRENQDILELPTRNRGVSLDKSFDFTQDRQDEQSFGRRNRVDDSLLGGRNRPDYVTEENSKKDIFAGTTDKKQCKYCDKLIGIEYQFCPFCGFKQDK